METITEFLIDWGYWGLFLSALIAGTLLLIIREQEYWRLTAHTVV